MCTYTETWSVPANDGAAIEDYLTIFGRYLFNISNTSLWNISITPDSPEQFLKRAEPLDLQQQRRLQDAMVGRETDALSFLLRHPVDALYVQDVEITR